MSDTTTDPTPFAVTVTSAAASIFGVVPSPPPPATGARPTRTAPPASPPPVDNDTAAREPQATSPGSPPVPTDYTLPAPLDLSRVDWSLVYELRSEVIDRWSAQIEPTTDEATRLQIGKRIVPQVIRDHSDNAVMAGDTANQIVFEDREMYRKAVESATFGQGRLQPLLDDPDFEDLEMFGPSSVVMAYNDRIEVRPPVADTSEELYAQIAVLAHMSRPPKDFSAANPEVTLNLGERFRLYAKGYDTMGGGAGPSISIRQHKATGQSLAQIAAGGMFPAAVADFLAAAMRAKQSTLVSGNPGAGKTTLVRSLFGEMDPNELVVSIESDAELFLSRIDPLRLRVRECLVREGSLEAVGPDGRPMGEFSMGRHFRGALRMNPAIIIVGEIRSKEEAFPAMQAMQQGKGTLSTIHAQSATATIERIVTALAEGGQLTVADAYRQVGDHINLVVHLDRARDPRTQRLTRWVSEIVEITGHRDQTKDSGILGVSSQTVYDCHDPHRPLAERMSDKLRNALTREGWTGQ